MNAKAVLSPPPPSGKLVLGISIGSNRGGRDRELFMSRDIDHIIERLRVELPGVKVSKLEVAHPSDDNGLWFFKIPGMDGTVQIESSHGNCPFLIESDSGDDRFYGGSIDEVVMKIRRLLPRRDD